MGGKIRAYNKITKYAEELARQQHNGGMQEVIMSTDQAYWQVISLVNKKKLAEGNLDTHSKKVVMNKEFLRQVAMEAGCSPDVESMIEKLTLARELWTLLSEEDSGKFFP